MKSFTVVYLAEAEDSLARIWTDSTDPNAVAAAANSADQQLANDPFEYSGSLPKNKWLFETGSLRFLYRVSLDDRLVQITHVLLR